MLSVTEKVFGSILTETLMAVIEGKVSEEQGHLGKEKDVWIRYLQLK